MLPRPLSRQHQPLSPLVPQGRAYALLSQLDQPLVGSVQPTLDHKMLGQVPRRPSYERRLYHRNLMARRLLIRYHPSARQDLARLRCDVTARASG